MKILINDTENEVKKLLNYCDLSGKKVIVWNFIKISDLLKLQVIHRQEVKYIKLPS